MEKKILLIFKEIEAALAVKRALEKSFSKEGVMLFLDMEQSRSVALQRIRSEKYSLIISHLNIYPGKQNMVDKDEQDGLLLLQKLAKENLQVPSILVSPYITGELCSTVNLIPDSSIVADGTETSENEIIHCAKNVLKRETKSEIKKRAVLDIHVNLGNKDFWLMETKGIGFSCDMKPQPLTVDFDRIKKLLKSSKRIKYFQDDYPDWEVALCDIGDDLMKQIFFNTQKARDCFTELKTIVGGIENFKIRFIVEKDIHPLVLESLVEKNAGRSNFWMLKAHIYRKVALSSFEDARLKPLYEDEETREGKINCLIIESNVEGWDEEIYEELELLKNVPEESKWLEEHLNENQHSFALDKVVRLPNKDFPAPVTREKVENVLTDGTHWHLVHYAGHSFYDSRNKKGVGYLFFQGSKGVERENIEKFSGWLREAKTRFIYMSSCHSSEEDFVFELAEKGIPSAIGFRWDIDDPKAFEHTRIFYKHLFRLRSLEYAFLNTRQDMHAAKENHIIWAAPMLIMQAKT
jgi:hypothetical protein